MTDNEKSPKNPAAEAKAGAIGKFIEDCQAAFWNDSDIIEALLKDYTQEELESLGFGNFIRDYFHAEAPDAEAGPQ